jgi:hypothetical protein
VRSWQERKRQELPVVRPSFPAWKEHPLIEAGIIDGLTDSAKRLKPLLIALVLIEEILNRSFDELIHILVLPTAKSSLTRPSISGDKFVFLAVPRPLIL